MEQHQDGVLAPRGVSKVGPAMAVAQTRRSELGVVAPPHNHTINTFLEGYAEQAESETLVTRMHCTSSSRLPRHNNTPAETQLKMVKQSLGEAMLLHRVERCVVKVRGSGAVRQAWRCAIASRFSGENEVISWIGPFGAGFFDVA